MPSWQGQNSKSLEAKARRSAQEQERQRSEAERKDNELWRDDDKKALAKVARQNEKDGKAEAKAKRKAELREIASKEDAVGKQITKPEEKPNKKLTQAEIAQKLLVAAMKKSEELASQQQKQTQADIPLQENPNLIIRQEMEAAKRQGIEYVSASGVDDALSALCLDSPVDRNPEKRRKANYLAYEEEWLPKLKEMYPSLKRQQLKDKIWKQWLKAPENPSAKQGL